VGKGTCDVGGLCAVDLIQINAPHAFGGKLLGGGAPCLLSLLQTLDGVRREVTGNLVVRTVAALGVESRQSREVNRFGNRILLAGALKEQLCLLQEFGERRLSMRLVEQVNGLARRLFKLLCWFL